MPPIKKHAGRIASEAAADILSHIVIKTVVDPLINTFLPKVKNRKTEAKSD